MQKKKMLIILSAAAVVMVSAFIFIPERRSPEIPKDPPVAASTAAERTDYFAMHGWEVEEIAGKSVTIPTEFSDTYERYAEIQDKQGMPLREYAGRDATLYVYDVKNYSPDNKKMLAELLVCDDTAIASLVYSEDGGSLRLAVS